MVILYSKEVSPLRMKKAIRKYKRTKKFLEKCNDNIQKICDEASDSEAKKVLTTVENQSKEPLEPKSSFKEVCMTDAKLFIMSTDKLIDAKDKPAAKPEKESMENKTGALTKNKQPVDKSQTKVKQADPKEVITTDKNIADVKNPKNDKLKQKRHVKSRLVRKSALERVDATNLKQKESSVDHKEINKLKSTDSSYKDKSENLPKKFRRRNKKKKKNIPNTDSSDFKVKRVYPEISPNAKVETAPKTTTNDSKNGEKGSINTNNTPERDSEKVCIVHGLNHIYLEMFFQDMLQSLSENLLPTSKNENKDVDHPQDETFSVIENNLKNNKPEASNTKSKDIKRTAWDITPKATIQSNSKFVNQLFSKYVSADESSYKVHNAVSSITTNFVRILCRVWWNAETQVKKLRISEAEEILKDAQQVTRLLSIYCSIMHESYSSLVQLWSGHQVYIDFDFHKRLDENCMKANCTLAKALRDPVFEEELRKTTLASSIVIGEYLMFVYDLYLKPHNKTAAEDECEISNEYYSAACCKGSGQLSTSNKSE